MFQQIGTLTEEELTEFNKKSLKRYRANNPNAEDTAVYHSDDGRIWWSVTLDLNDAKQLKEELIRGQELLRVVVPTSEKLIHRLVEIGCDPYPLQNENGVLDIWFTFNPPNLRSSSEVE